MVTKFNLSLWVEPKTNNSNSSQIRENIFNLIQFIQNNPQIFNAEDFDLDINDVEGYFD